VWPARSGKAAWNRGGNVLKRYLHWFFLGAFLLTLLFDAVVWAGAARMPKIGEQLRISARREAPLTMTYMTVGGVLMTVPILRDYGVNYALEAFEPLIAPIRDKPLLAMELAHGEWRNRKHRTLQWMHLAGPLLLIAWVLTYSRRSRKVHFLPGRR